MAEYNLRRKYDGDFDCIGYNTLEITLTLGEVAELLVTVGRFIDLSDTDTILKFFLTLRKFSSSNGQSID